MRNFLLALSVVVVGLTPVLRQKQPSAPPRSEPLSAQPSKPEVKVKEDVSGPPQIDLAPGAVKIIATIADPRATRLGLEFDRWIDSLLRAAAAAGYEFQTHWLPWSSKNADRNEPGRLIFRKGSGGQVALVILLVGESPVGGINREQFRTALSALPGAKLVGVLAPAFSGGFVSLSELLGPVAKTTPIATGSATSAQAAADFCDGCFRLSRSVDDDTSARKHFLDYLSGRGVKPRRVADLTETDTVYGSQKSGDQLKFPRDISVLRRAYESNQLLQKSLDQGSVAPGDTSRLPGEDLKSGEDSVPVQTPAATAATEDLEMQEIARRLHEGRYSLGRFLATNPFDILFLREYLNSRVPDLQFYLLEPDILFLHKPEVHAFRGTLAVSRYPLFVTTTEQSEIFSSKSAEGVYWAVRSLLGKNSEGQSSSLWLSIIGIDGYWPVARLATDQDYCAGSSCPVSSANASEAHLEIRPTKVYVALWLISFSALLFVVTAVVMGDKVLRNKQPAARKWFADFLCDPKAPLALSRSYNIWCLLLGLAAVLLVLTRPLVEAWGSWLYVTVIPVLAGLLRCHPFKPAAATDTTYVSLDAKTKKSDEAITAGLTISITFAVLVILFFLFVKVWGAPGGNWAFFAAYRSVHLGNGVNPTLPFFLTAVSVLSCAWFHFQRFVFASERFVPLALPRLGTLDGPYSRVRDILARYATTPALVASFAVIVLVVVVLVSYRSALTIEGGHYDRCFIAALTVASFFTMLSVCQFLQAWWNLSDFLTALQELPLRHVFAKLPRELGSLALFSAGTRERSYLYSVRARDCLRQIPDLPAGLLSSVEAALSAVQTRAGADERETYAEAQSLQSALFEANSHLLCTLNDHWAKGESELIAAKDKIPDDMALSEDFVALRILGFIRYAMLQLRNLLTYFSVGFILQVMAVSSYPFFSRSLSKMFIFITFVVLSGAVGYVLWRMGHDATLRSLAVDENGKDHPVIRQALQSASLPLIAFAGTYFPELGSSLFGWVHAALEMGK